MLDAKGIEYRYREIRREPLSVAEIEALLERLALPPSAVLRRRDRACKQLRLAGDEPAAVLVEAMSRHPTLLARPIGVKGDRAVLGRPPERLLELAAG